MSKARYPDQQDRNEEGLSLLRAQYEHAGNPHLAWQDTKPPEKRAAQIRGANCCITLSGEPEQITAVATLICRAVNLGWEMLNELEPQKEEVPA